MEFRALVPGSIELQLLCHVTLLYCQVDPNPESKAKSKAKKSLWPLPILPHMCPPLAHLNQCYSSNSMPFMQVSSRVGWALLVRATSERFPPARATFKSVLARESHWLQPLLVFTVRWWSDTRKCGRVITGACH